MTLLYSFSLKRIPILDGFVLASLFTLRLGAGIVASGAPPSPWLLVFAMFLFASLSFAKRHTEVARVVERGGTEVRGRGYKSIDLPLIMGIGMATGVAAVLIMVLYIINDAFRQSFYGNTAWLWGFPAILFLFVCRIWLKCGRERTARRSRGLCGHRPAKPGARRRLDGVLRTGMVGNVRLTSLYTPLLPRAKRVVGRGRGWGVLPQIRWQNKMRR